VASVLTQKGNEQSLHLQQILTLDSLKLLFPDPLVDPAPPDIILIPINGTNYEPSLSTALPAVQAEHGGFNENETHVPLLVVHNSLPTGQNRAPVTLTQIAPTILSLLGMDPNSLQAVQLEGTKVLYRSLRSRLRIGATYLSSRQSRDHRERRLGQVVLGLDGENVLPGLILQRPRDGSAKPIKLDGLDRALHLVVRPAQVVEQRRFQLVVADEREGYAQRPVGSGPLPCLEMHSTDHVVRQHQIPIL
jgi:ribosomal protein L27